MLRTDDFHLRFVLTTLCIFFIVAVVNAAFGLGALPIAITVTVLYVVYFIYGFKVKDHTIWLWLVFGFVTGMVELASNCDYYLVDEKQVLIYPNDLRKIGVTPSYLRFAWGLVFMHLGLIGWWINKQRNSRLEAVLLIALIGAVLIGVFENLARQAGWWYYQNTPLLVWTPYFVNVFEFLSTLLIVPVGWWIASRSLKQAYIWAVVLGVAMGIWMCVAMRIAYWLLGPCSGAILQFPCTFHNLPPVWGPLG